MTKIIQMTPRIHPYMDVLQKTLETQKKLLELSERQSENIKEWIDRNKDSKLLDVIITVIRYEIEIIELKGKINSLSKSIKDKEQYFIKYMQQFTIDADECEKHFDSVMSVANEKAKSNPVIKELVDRINWDMVKINIEVKVNLYKKMRDLTK